MFRPLAITAARYRAFARPTRLELRPLTLLCGRNNAGKSALLRLLSVIADSVAENASSPLVLTGPAGGRASFENVRYGGGAPEANELGIELSFHWPAAAPLSEIRYLLDSSREENRTYVREVTLHNHRGMEALKAAAYPPYRENRYEIHTDDGAESRQSLSFTGLLPGESAAIPEFAQMHRLMSALRGRIQWLQAKRAQPQRLVQASGGAPRLLGADGQEAIDVLLTNPEMLEEVAGWYERAVARSFELKPYGGHFRPLLNPLKHRFDVELIDTGEGMTQILPVLVALAMARRHLEGWPTIVAIEEPESHLHPDTQRALAEHLCRVAAEPDPPAIVLETHSNALVLAVQLAIARGDIAPERVCAYWVDTYDDGTSVAKPAEFDSRGNPDGNWPPSTFAEERELARELVAYQL